MTLMNFNKLKDSIIDAENVVIIAGAGVSTDSGLSDYKSNDKIQKNKLFSIEYFNDNPILFWKYFKSMFNDVLNTTAKVNDNHLFVEDLINEGKNVTVITQNVDSLFLQVNGLELGHNYFEIHGNLRDYYCPHCNEKYSLEWIIESNIPYCKHDECSNILRPNMVLAGEQPKYFRDVILSIRNADTIIVMGTTFNTYPLNTVLQYNSYANKILINNEMIKNHMLFDIICIGDLQSYLSHFKSEERKLREEQERLNMPYQVEENYYITDDILTDYILEDNKQKKGMKEL